jgi:formate C-acetyltransferase
VSQDPWREFEGEGWKRAVDVRDLMQQNYKPYPGDGSFLAGPSARTKGIWAKLGELFKEERKKGVLDVSRIPSTIMAHVRDTSTKRTNSSWGCRRRLR